MISSCQNIVKVKVDVDKVGWILERYSLRTKGASLHCIADAVRGVYP